MVEVEIGPCGRARAAAGLVCYDRKCRQAKGNMKEVCGDASPDDAEVSEECQEARGDVDSKCQRISGSLKCAAALRKAKNTCAKENEKEEGGGDGTGLAMVEVEISECDKARAAAGLVCYDRTCRQAKGNMKEVCGDASPDDADVSEECQEARDD